MRIFISHSSRQKPLVRDIIHRLPNHVRSWIDEESLLVGDDIESSLENAIDLESDYVLLFVDEYAVASKWVKKEIQWALSIEYSRGRQFLLPIVIDQTAWSHLPDEIRRKRYIECYDFSSIGIDTAVRKLETALFAIVSRDLERLKSQIKNKSNGLLMSEMRYDLNELTLTMNINSGKYELLFRKIITNISDKPISQVVYHFLANIYPNNPTKSYYYYTNNPILWDELAVMAQDEYGHISVDLLNDHGSRKDFLLRFSDGDVERPILPGDSREYCYWYSVGFQHWGPYIDRPINFPTEICRVKIIVPLSLQISVGGYEMSPFRPKINLGQRIEQTIEGETKFFRWESSILSLGHTYQLNWTPLLKGINHTTTAVTTQQLLERQGD